jgi:peptidyl-prolyl cis-trans isomerase C
MNRLFVGSAIAASALLAHLSASHAQVVTSPKAGAPASQSAPAPYVPPNPPTTELLHSSTVRLLQSDYNAQLMRLPEDSRMDFGTDISRINILLRTILVDKTLADEARKSGLAADPAIAAQVAAETDRILAKAVLDRDEARWSREFDALPDIEGAARERWLALPNKYRKPVEVKLTHILFTNAKHPDAKELASATRAKIVAGADMVAIARSSSDEPSAAEDGGQTDWAPANRHDPRLARAIASLKNVGDLSEPIRTQGGYYLVRLDGKRGGEARPFAEVKDEIIGEMRKSYVDEQRSKRMAAIRNDPSIVVNQPAVDKLVVRIDPDVLKKVREGLGMGVTPATSPAAPPAK